MYVCVCMHARVCSSILLHQRQRRRGESPRPRNWRPWHHLRKDRAVVRKKKEERRKGVYPAAVYYSRGERESGGEEKRRKEKEKPSNNQTKTTTTDEKLKPLKCGLLIPSSARGASTAAAPAATHSPRRRTAHPHTRGKRGGAAGPRRTGGAGSGRVTHCGCPPACVALVTQPMLS